MSKEQIIQMLEQEFIEQGYFYDGHISYGQFYSKGLIDEVWDLVKTGEVIKRSCEACSFELPIEHRIRLIQTHNLIPKWREKGTGFKYWIDEYERKAKAIEVVN